MQKLCKTHGKVWAFDHFCRVCGEPLEWAIERECPACKVEVQAGDCYCWACGTSTEEKLATIQGN